MNNQVYISPRSRRNYSRNQNLSRHQLGFRLGPVMHVLIMVLIVSLMGMIYLSNATKTNDYSYELNSIDTEIAQLQVKKADLEIEKARSESLAAVENSAVAKEMTAPATITYFKN